MELESSNLSAYLMIGTLAALVFGSLLYGVYMAFGAGSEQLTDQIEEHSRLHKLGIAHSHQGNGRAVARGGHSHHDHDVVKSWAPIFHLSNSIIICFGQWRSLTSISQAFSGDWNDWCWQDIYLHTYGKRKFSKADSNQSTNCCVAWARHYWLDAAKNPQNLVTASIIFSIKVQAYETVGP